MYSVRPPFYSVRPPFIVSVPPFIVSVSPSIVPIPPCIVHSIAWLDTILVRGLGWNRHESWDKNSHKYPRTYVRTEKMFIERSASVKICLFLCLSQLLVRHIILGLTYEQSLGQIDGQSHKVGALSKKKVSVACEDDSIRKISKIS